MITAQRLHDLAVGRRRSAHRAEHRGVLLRHLSHGELVALGQMPQRLFLLLLMPLNGVAMLCRQALPQRLHLFASLRRLCARRRHRFQVLLLHRFNRLRLSRCRGVHRSHC